MKSAAPIFNPKERLPVTMTDIIKVIALEKMR